MEMGIPTLVGVNALNIADFAAFAAGTAQALPAELPAILAWHETFRAPGILAAE